MDLLFKNGRRKVSGDGKYQFVRKQTAVLKLKGENEEAFFKLYSVAFSAAQLQTLIDVDTGNKEGKLAFPSNSHLHAEGGET